jgi:hypothetical protein
MKRIIWIQFIVLFIGTAFAWFNFVQEFINWTMKKSCTTGCISGLVNPFLTPCFYGAIFFTIAFVLSIILVKKVKK